MAAQGPTNKSKIGLGGLPARFKSFVHNMKTIKKDTYQQPQRTRSEGGRSTQPSPSQRITPTPNQDSSISETRSLFRASPQVRSLSIRVTVNFGEPLNYAHSQDYEGSSLLQPTEDLCEALIRRVDHCSKELITRRDSSALDRTGTDGLAKPLRYEIQLQVLRHEVGTGTEAWASRTLRSYQRQPLGTDAAREVILSTHYMVGLFLRHHDEAFVWKDSPVREDPMHEQTTFQYRPGRVQPLTSIPRSFFIERQQDFESIPGYTIRFSFTSQDHHRTPPQWHDTVEVNSRQLSPLTLASAENLFLDACYAVDGVFKSQRREFEGLQKSCASHSGCRHCRQQDGDGIEMLVAVKNNVGPLFDNLERTTCTNVNVLWKDDATDCIEFVEKAKAAIVQVCRDTDEAVSRMTDFEFYIIELRGRGWTMDEPLAFTLGPETCLDRRTVETLLDRLQTGVADVLRGNAIAVRMTARKRGHFILHKTLVAREPMEKPGSNKKSVGKSKAYVIDRLKQRIERDIEMVCKDTCTIANRDIETANPDRITGAPSQDFSSLNTGLVSTSRLSDITIPSKILASNEINESSDRLGSRGSELLETPDPSSSSSSIPQHQWTKVTRDPVTGARIFPLVPGRRVPHELATTSSRRSNAGHDEPSRDGATVTSFDVSTSQEQSSTSTAQTTSDSSTSNTEQYSTSTFLTESQNSRRERYVTEGSIVSTRPRTPELEFGGSPSIHSSAMMTPKIHESVLNNEIDIVRQITPGVGGGESDGIGEVDSYPRKFYMHRPISSPAPRLASQHSSIRSTVSKGRPMRKEQALSNLGVEDSSSSDTESSSQSEPGVERRSSGAKLTNNTAPPVEPMPEQDTPAEREDNSPPASEVEAAVEAEREDFSQSKPGFDFSSPPTITPPENSSGTEETAPPAEKTDAIADPGEPQENQYTTSPGPSNDGTDSAEVETPPSAHPEHPEPPSLQHQHSKSFGSAGYIGGFQDQRFYGVGLRRALAGPSTPPSRPLSRLGFREDEQQPRPGTAT
ncbi:hypothetical protein F4825DRAFT_243226 [Nemania diffusa]|nr:hypothetical protein F4825DRAFT_243226 [Nemania diffusa]